MNADRMRGVQRKFVMAGGIRTHYLEAGDGPVLVLLHSGEFGACAETTWEFNIAALARHFRVLAPDWLGFGKTDKLFDFEDMWGRRVRHVRDFLDVLCVERAHFMGNSFGGSVLITVAAMNDGVWPMERCVVVSGGGYAPENAARKVLTSYDCTREHMRRVVEVLVRNPAVRSDEDYIERRFQASLAPGAWECTAAARFKAPGSAPFGGPKRPRSYEGVRVPVLLVAGAEDNLREPGYAQALVKEVPGAALALIPDAGHCPQIDHPELFNRTVIEFLLGKGGG